MARLGAALWVSLSLAALPGVGMTAPCTLLSDLDAFAETRAAPSGAECFTYLTTTGATGTSCQWEFAYRSETPKTFASDLWRMIETCKPGGQMREDDQVNHPDSYGLRVWQADQNTYAVAVKDKAQLNATFVFLRSEPARPGE